MIEKSVKGWHGCISRHPGRKPLYHVSLMRKDHYWFDGEAQTARVAFNRAVKAAGGNPDATFPLPKGARSD